MLVCDLDGTLLTSKGTMTDATVNALHQAVAAGVEVAFATGRRHTFAWDVLAPVGLHPDTVLISSNGALTRTFAGELLHRIGMPTETALLLCRQLTRFRSSLVFTFERTGLGALIVEDLETLHRSIARWVESNRHEIERMVPLERAFEGGEEPVQAMVCGTMHRMEEAMSVLAETTAEASDLRRRLSIHRTEYASRDLCIVDLMPAACSKGNAIAQLATQRGIDRAHIAAIGDNMNDADMLAYAGHAVVMNNGAAELLATARENNWFVTASNDEDGAAQAILRMLEGMERPVAVSETEISMLAD